MHKRANKTNLNWHSNSKNSSDHLSSSNISSSGADSKVRKNLLIHYAIKSLEWHLEVTQNYECQLDLCKWKLGAVNYWYLWLIKRVNWISFMFHSFHQRKGYKFHHHGILCLKLFCTWYSWRHCHLNTPGFINGLRLWWRLILSVLKSW